MQGFSPSRCASHKVADTVVAAQLCCASTAERSRRFALLNGRGGASWWSAAPVDSAVSGVSADRATASISAALSPRRTTPSRTAIIAGTALDACTAASIASAVSRFSGQGSPWAMTVDSRKTKGRSSGNAVLGASGVQLFIASMVSPVRVLLRDFRCSVSMACSIQRADLEADHGFQCLAETGDVCVSGLEKSSLRIRFMSGVWT